MIRILMAAMISLYLLGYTESKAQTYQQYYEYNYSYEVRTACRDNGYKYGFYYAIVCADNLIEEQRQEEMRLAQLELLRSETELNITKSKRIKDSYHRRRSHLAKN
jgi:hypothetical protein